MGNNQYLNGTELYSGTADGSKLGAGRLNCFSGPLNPLHKGGQ